MRTFNMLFKMPKDKELFVAAWAAICSYEKRIRESSVPSMMTVIAEDDWLTQLLIPPMTFVTQSVDDVKDMFFDTTVDFSDDRILELSRFGKKAASICGAFLGIEDYVNELVVIKPVEIKFDVCIIPWSKESACLWDKVNDKFPWLFAFNAPNAPNGIYGLKSKVIVSYRSTETYLAASANRIVLEGYDLETYDRNFLTKWSNPRYNMVCVEKKCDLDKNLSLIWRALERICNAIPRVT